MSRTVLHLLRALPGLLLLAGCTGPLKKKTFDPYAPPTTPATATTATVSADGTRTRTSGRIEPSMLVPPTTEFTLGPGDVLDIELIGAPEGPQQAFVGPDGKIYFHLLSGQQVWGLTLPQTQRLLEKELGRFVQTPQVSLTLREVHSRRVWVLGRVSTPGLYDLGQPMTVLEAVSKAGGLFTSRMGGTTEELADLHHSFLIRKDQLIPVDFNALIREGDTSQNVYLQPDDFLYLPSSMGSQVYVLGAVYQPRAVAYKDQVTLITALANCRGLVKGAKSDKIAIVRGSLTTPTIAIVDAGPILTGKKPDILLQPKDIIYVPQTSPGSLASYADLIVRTFARTVAANEGARAGGADAPVGVNIGIGQ
ncbi:MAG: polysaccharide export protein Wza [Verrucomicrobiales bacterium]|nr:polysaccharide export protein Wza [Verrucomicrobiales bacterium]